MNITRRTITVRELIEGYEEKGQDGIEGVVAFGKRLDVRPPYQREFIYPNKDRDEVIRSVLKGFPINVMYWAKTGEDHYELMDGQQRSISICRYAAKNYQNFSIDGCFLTGMAHDSKNFFNWQAQVQEKILDYPLDIYICDGTPDEILSWFRVINIAGMKLTEQELRNTSYTGPWLADAKLFFSKPNCIASNLGKDYVSGSPIRQELLEKVLSWIVDLNGLSLIEDYMSLHQLDSDAEELKQYFRDVIDWVEKTFIVKRAKEMKGVNWGYLYNRFHHQSLDPNALEEKIKKLMADSDVTNKSGIYEYVLNGSEKALSIRVFDANMKREAYERQHGKCAICGHHFAIDEMHADHKKPWSRGGHTVASNCQMLCVECNLKKGNH